MSNISGAGMSEPTTPRTVSRRPKVGDVVLSDQGNLYEVEGVHYDGASRRIYFYAVIDLAERRYPNSLSPDRVKVVAAADALRLRQAAKEEQA